MLPVIPGGAGAAIKAVRTAEKAGDAIQSLKASTKVSDEVKKPDILPNALVG